MDWEKFISVGLLVGVGILALSRTRFNKKYFFIALVCILLLWGFFTLIGYG